MRAELIKALKSHAQGHIDKHIANVEVQLQKATGDRYILDKKSHCRSHVVFVERVVVQIHTSKINFFSQMRYLVCN